ncbi:MAG: [Muribaculaceae bacterium]|nr:[citrate (pro-3S)-lyase] ligase [Muribaculaceae bacterium]
MYSEYDLHSVPLSFVPTRQRVERFLSSCGLRLDPVDSYAVVTRLGDDTILAGGGLAGNVIKCVAVSDALRGTGMMQRLLSHLLSQAHAAGHTCVRVFTKPDNREIFESLGFRLLAQAPQAIFMENGLPGIDGYLQQIKSAAVAKAPADTAGVIVMNANPFTLGHQALVQWAAQQVQSLYVIAVREDCSTFSYAERLHMIREGCRPLGNVTVLEGSDYAISAVTFPTYFLKRLDEAADTQITLDLDLFARHIAPALGASRRFVGSEPTDALTARYVELMQQQLPPRGIEVRVMPRLTDGEAPVSASRVRRHLDENHLYPAAQLVPATTLPELLGHLAHQALQQELDTTPKPGLVDRQDSGAHHDMTYATMQQGLDALTPFFDEVAEISNHNELPDSAQLLSLGQRGEAEMLHATQGVNTHRGALFALGLIDAAAAHTLHQHGHITASDLQHDIMSLAGTMSQTSGTHGSEAVCRHHVNGAMAMAQSGYRQLFGDWLPYYRALAGDPWQRHKTLLHIIAQLDDTNVIHRVGYDRAQQVKAEAQALLDHFTPAALEDLNRRYIAENISPGGAADMLALTIFADALVENNEQDLTDKANRAN